MIEVYLNKIKIDESVGEQIIVLKEKEGVRYLPIAIGISEVQAISLKVKAIETPRPMTHDLIVNLSKELNAQLEEIIVDRIEDNTFYAKIHLSKKRSNKTIVLDARPSDAIALAVRAEVPIYVADEVFESAGLLEY